MKLIFMTVASAREAWSTQAEELYLKKISHFIKIEKVEVAPPKSAREDSDSRKKAEGEKILSQIKNDDYLVVFDERGMKLDSIQFSKRLERVLGSGKKRTVFLIGGAYGTSEEVRSRAQLIISFSDLVFNHLVAQTVAYEQIYRAFTLLKGLPYHNA